MEKQQHSLVLKGRTDFSTTGVTHVDSYDEHLITLHTTMGILTIKGEELKINNLCLEQGTLNVNGKVDELIYSENQGKKARGMLQRIFK